MGELADRAAKWMNIIGLGKMYCLAAIGGHVQQYIVRTKKTKDIIIIDGCSNACAKKALNEVDIHGKEFDLEKMGFQKGNVSATGENIDRIVNMIQNELKESNYENQN